MNPEMHSLCAQAPAQAHLQKQAVRGVAPLLQAGSRALGAVGSGAAKAAPLVRGGLRQAGRVGVQAGKATGQAALQAGKTTGSAALTPFRWLHNADHFGSKVLGLNRLQRAMGGKNFHALDLATGHLLSHPATKALPIAGAAAGYPMLKKYFPNATTWVPKLFGGGQGYGSDQPGASTPHYGPAPGSSSISSQPQQTPSPQNYPGTMSSVPGQAASPPLPLKAQQLIPPNFM